MLTREQQELEKILEAITEELDIPDSKYEDATKKYKTVDDWLRRSTSTLFPYKPKIFAQGSFRLGTCIKPLGQDEYDIDLVCKLQIKPNSNQKDIYNLIGDRLKENEIYKSKLESKNRCWRLNYAGDFHMDILPAIPDDKRNDSSILVPDKELKVWQCSNPEGYISWFIKQMEVQWNLLKSAKNKAEEIPEYTIKTPLQRSIQILKRHRDIVFLNDLADKPISIIITTLAAKAYNNEADLFEALSNIIKGMPKQFDFKDGELAVLNPTNDDENFADKWKKHPQRKDNFLSWLNSLDESLNEILNLRGPHVKKALDKLFGDKIVDNAFKKLAEKTEKLRKDNNLKMDPQIGYLGMSGIPIRKNTFYGDEINSL
ncbi:nucleotidyltransferase [candidate division KSB1 bacterium]|nr:nucleotidyltransferase [candidate division KSB1 bacterium]